MAPHPRDRAPGERGHRWVVRLEGGDGRDRQPGDAPSPQAAVEALGERLDLGQLRHGGAGWSGVRAGVGPGPRARASRQWSGIAAAAAPPAALRTGTIQGARAERRRRQARMGGLELNRARSCAWGCSTASTPTRWATPAPRDFLLLLQLPSAVIGDGDVCIRLSSLPAARGSMYEGELGRHHRPPAPARHAAGTPWRRCPPRRRQRCHLATDIQAAEEQWTRAKGSDSPRSLGPRGSRPSTPAARASLLG